MDLDMLYSYQFDHEGVWSGGKVSAFPFITERRVSKKLSKQPKYIFRKPVLYRISSKQPAATRNSRLVGTFKQGVKNYRARDHYES